jgi:chemotaxis protein MotB
VGDVVNDLKRKKLRIVGHTDSVPIGEELRWKYPSNWELSAHRAAAVVRFLQNQCRVDPEHMEAVGRSCYHPVSSNKTPRGRARNRRVEIVIAPKYQDKDRG